MENKEVSVTCVTVVEWMNAQGITTRKINYRTATSRLVRNNLKHLLIEITPQKSSGSTKLHVRDISVLNRFAGEGKASIKFKAENCTLYFSNAPAGDLIHFLKTIYIKLNGKEDDSKSMKNPLKEKLVSNNGGVEDISPATVAELKRAKEKADSNSKSTISTPSPTNVRKRKLGEGSTSTTPKIPRAKKLFHNPTLDEMNEEQTKVLEAVKKGKNIFFTGSAGTGKSYLLRKIIAALPPDVTKATASTGVAACHIGGITLHQFAGIGLGTATMERCKQMVSKSSVGSIWRKTKHLIIDEISMVDGDYFDKVEEIARYVRNSEKPFGGIQLILCGDFFQLPPVTKKGEEKVKFCFQSEAWAKCVELNFELTTVHRQTDKKFVDILNKIRVGDVNDEIVQVLKDTGKQKIEIDGILATRLCSHVKDANEINEFQLNKLPGKSKVYLAEDSDEYNKSALDQQLTVPSRLELKVGAQVMLLKNLDLNTALVNGARGIVVKFEDDLPVVHFRSGTNYKAKWEKWSIKTAFGGTIYRKQLPLKLAWAFSIHKSQGLTLDCVEMNLEKVFDSGQAYVALSRAQSLQCLKVLEFSREQVWANKEVLNFYKRFRRQMSQMEIVPLGKKFKSSKQLVTIC